MLSPTKLFNAGVLRTHLYFARAAAGNAHIPVARYGLHGLELWTFGLGWPGWVGSEKSKAGLGCVGLVETG